MEEVKELLITDEDKNSPFRLVYGLSPFVSYLSEQNIDCKPLFESAGIEEHLLEVAGATMNLEQEQIFSKMAMDALNDSGIGLKIGSRFNLSAFGMLGLTLMSSATLADGLKAAINLQSLTWSRLSWRLLQGNDIAIFEASSREPLGDSLNFILERDFVATITVCKELLGKCLPLKEVHLSYPPPEYALEYEAIFNCPVKFDSPKNQIFFDAHWLAENLQRSNIPVHKVSYAQCQELATKVLDSFSYRHIIERILIDSSGAFPSLSQVTEKLHLTPRTLHRKLAQEDTNFQAIVSDVRVKIANDLLLNSNLTIEQIADQLGYSDSASFCHAFKRWTGMPPSAVRQ